MVSYFNRKAVDPSVNILVTGRLAPNRAILDLCPIRYTLIIVSVRYTNERHYEGLSNLPMQQKDPLQPSYKENGYWPGPGYLRGCSMT